jgi:glucoamylase
MPKGKNLRIEVLAPCELHWSIDNWKTIQKQSASYSGLGIYFVDLYTKKLSSEEKIVFTFYWTEVDVWENKNFSVEVE